MGHKITCKNNFVILIIFLSFLSSVKAQISRSIYYISIGSTHYEKSKEDLSNCDNWTESLPSANISAKIFAETAKRLYPNGGILLTSTSKKVVSKQRIFEAFQELGLAVKRDTAVEKIVLIYFYVHGASNNVNQVLYLIPGDIGCEGEYFYVEEMDKKAISIHTLVNLIRIHLGNVTPVIFLDCCYSFRKANPEYKRMTDSVDSSFWRSPHWVGPWSMMRRWDADLTPWPVLYSSPKGGISEAVVYNNTNKDKIGPVCKSFITAINNSATKLNPSLSSLIYDMKTIGINSNGFTLFNIAPGLKIKNE